MKRNTKGVGMKKILDDRLVMIQGGELFKNQDVYFMIPYKKDKILIIRFTTSYF